MIWPLALVAAGSSADIDLQFATNERNSVPPNKITLAELKVGAANSWQELNRGAMSPARIPPEMPGLLARILTLSPVETDSEHLNLLAAALDGYNAELEMILREPEKLGMLSTPVPGPFTAGSRQPIVQVYTVGSVPIGPGGGLLLTSHWLNPIQFQTTDSEKPGFIRVSSSNSLVAFTFKRLLRGGIHGGLEKAGFAMLLEVASGQLQPGDTVQIYYGGSRGVQLPDRSSDGFSLPVYVRLVEDGHFNSLTVPVFQVLGDSVQSVSVVAPSIVQAGQAFTVSLTAQDRYGNKASGLVPSFDILVNDTFYTRIDSGYEALGSIANLVISAPGLYTIAVRSSGGGISAVANPVKVVQQVSQQILWGELGRKTDMSIGLNSIDFELKAAREERHLDFIAATDIDSMIDDWEWEHLLAAAGRYSANRDFKVFPGLLRSLPTDKGGSQAVVFSGEENKSRISQHDVPRLVGFYQKLRQMYRPRDVLVVPNTLRVGDWRFIDPGFVSLVEIKNAQGFFNWYAEKYLARGYRLGFAASNEVTQWPEHLFPGGLTAVMVDQGMGAGSPSRAALFDALKSGRTYVTSGNRMIMDFRINEGHIGDRVQAVAERRVSGEIIATGPLEWVEVVKNSQPVWRKSFFQGPDSAAGSLQLKVEFSSDSVPAMNVIAPPTEAMEWIGFISTNSGSFTALSKPSLSGSDQRQAIINPGNARRIDFITQTRGNQSGFIAELDGVTQDLVFDISIMGSQPGAEIANTGGVAASSGIHQKVSLLELYKGPVSRNIQDGALQGQLNMELVEPATENTLRFDFTDPGMTESADYYYLKIKQQDGNYGWSSPIWVGGFDLE